MEERRNWYGSPVDSVNDTLTQLRAFNRERDWGQFHSPENVAKSIAIEAGELLECYQWTTETDTKRVAGELADVLTYCLLLADVVGLDPLEIIREKLSESSAKYPVTKSKGRSTKYDQL